MRLALGLAVLGIGVSDQPNGAAPLAKKVPGIDQALSASPSGGRGSEEDTAVLGTIKSGAWLGNRKHLARTRKSGVIAILYGGGAGHDPEGNRRRPLLPPRPPLLPFDD